MKITIYGAFAHPEHLGRSALAGFDIAQVLARAGELLKALPRSKGGRPFNSPPKGAGLSASYENELETAGIAKGTAQKWQWEHALPEAVLTKLFQDALKSAGGDRSKNAAPRFWLSVDQGRIIADRKYFSAEQATKHGGDFDQG